MPTFKTEALRLVSNVLLVKGLLLRNEWQVQHYTLLLNTMHFITKATPIGYIDSQCHYRQIESSRTCLIGYSGFISREWYVHNREESV